MTRKGLSQVLNQKIPLSKALGIQVKKVSPLTGVEFSLPLKPNRNHKGTAFGGTLIAAQALASWSFVMTLLESQQVEAEVVIQHETSHFLKPVRYDFLVKTKNVKVTDLNKFFKTLQRHGKARLNISAEVVCRKEIAATFSGAYVAIKSLGEK